MNNNTLYSVNLHCMYIATCTLEINKNLEKKCRDCNKSKETSS